MEAPHRTRAAANRLRRIYFNRSNVRLVQRSGRPIRRAAGVRGPRAIRADGSWPANRGIGLQILGGQRRRSGRMAPRRTARIPPGPVRTPLWRIAATIQTGVQENTRLLNIKTGVD